MARKKGKAKYAPGMPTNHQQGHGAKKAMKHLHVTVQKRMRGR